ncbi:MAG TPA: IS1182 family transposase [Blastocatellia bacterium]|nr:IS1182 family transposase [Blastocatellia bacterium]
MRDEQLLPALTDPPPFDLEHHNAASENQEANPDPRHTESPKPRFEPIDRQQLVMRAVDVEQLVDQDHPVRAIWEFVGRLNLSGFCEHIRAVEGERGRPTYHPRLMISLWIYAYSRGVSFAREIARLCEYDPACQWLTGMKVVNYHSLSDFRVDHGEALKNLFAEVLGLLSVEGLVDLERVMHDGTKIKACGSPRTFRREKRVEEHLELARKHVAELEAESEEDEGRRAKARQRAAREKQQRLESALEEFKKIRERELEAKRKKEEIRVSETEPEARIMKHNDGGFAPSYNAQISTDRLGGVIVGVGLSQEPSDYDELLGSVDRVEENTGELPVQVVADGGYTSANNIHGMGERGIDFIAPVADCLTQLEQKGIDRGFSRQAFVYDEATNSYTCPEGKTLSYKGKERRGKWSRYRYRASAADCQDCPFKEQCCPQSKRFGRSLMRSEHQSEVDSHAAKMGTEEAKEIYKQRGQTAEFPAAWIKEKLGLRRFRVRGLVKAGLEVIWACVTYNIQQWIRLRWRDRWDHEKNPLCRRRHRTSNLTARAGWGSRV